MAITMAAAISNDTTRLITLPPGLTTNKRINIKQRMPFAQKRN